ncbi:GDSL-type esterase/lipase family protein [Xanthobacteraceae bacterium Astr-EGSB]|uniref:SGNH/GDSL hydrolase family protein n=1 Tax=Astrobacterium formosum TaxID=3069710 RepID=UPI0027B23889|nr:GDSL-type esterase/lipase family protein [Xanthobacteraceae bacterium Astr-EGSB]
MRRSVGLLAVLVSGLLTSAIAVAGEQKLCDVPEHLVDAEYAAPQAAAAIAAKRLKIVVLGTFSSVTGGPFKSYPTRLEEEMAARLPGVEVSVKSLAKPGETAATAEKMLEQVIADERPALVVWQTGTVDAIRGVDLEDFRIDLSNGIETLHDAKVDVVLMNMQYSPRTESMIALGSYAEAMRLVAVQYEVPLFDRFSVMKHWNENGTFDLYAATKKTDVADRVHQCIGRLLGGQIVEAANMAAKPGKDGN